MPRPAHACKRVERTSLGSSGARRALLLAPVFLGLAGVCPAQDAAQKANTRLEEVVVEARRQAADQQVTRQVQKALSEDPWIYAEHVTVTTQNGVVRLEGVVADVGELLRIVRLCRRIPGTRRVSTSDVEINAQLPDGG